MTKLKKTISLPTAYGVYLLDEILGEGGAGRVFGGRSEADGEAVAVKVLRQDRADSKARKRFKNETSFLQNTRHPNLVEVLDSGVGTEQVGGGPFYVMPRYSGSLRGLMQARLKPEAVLPLFAMILDGVEAAHLHGVAHRDLKPENVLFKEPGRKLAVADFGIAHFRETLLHNSGDGQVAPSALL